MTNTADANAPITSDLPTTQNGQNGQNGQTTLMVEPAAFSSYAETPAAGVPSGNAADQGRQTSSLHRSQNGIIGGVCAGISETYGFDLTMVRLVCVITSLLLGVGPALYLLAWLIIPSATGEVLAARYARNARQRYAYRKAQREARRAAFLASANTVH